MSTHLPTRRLIAVGILGAIVAGDLVAQRGRRGFRRPRPGTTTNTPPPAPKAEKKDIKNYTAITGGTVYVGTGQVIHRATVLLGDSKIIKIGPGIEIPEKAKVIDATGKYVSPGFVIVAARGMGSGSTSDNPADSVNPFDPQMKMGLAAGITSFLSSGGSGNSTPGGTSAVFKCAYGDLKGMVLMHGNVLKMSVPLTMAKMKSFRDLVAKVVKYKAEKDAYDAKAAASGNRENPTRGRTTGRPPSGGTGGRPTGGTTGRAARRGGGAPKPPSGTENILKIMDGKAKLWIRCARGFDNDRIRQAMTIAKLLGVGVVLEDPTTGWSIPEEIAATGSMVVLTPRANVAPDPADPDHTGSNIAMAKILSDVGVPVAVHPPSGRFGGGGIGTGGILGQDLNTPHIDAAFAIRGGLDKRKALRTITLDAAKMMGAETRIGSLEEGKDADVLILDGKPLHYRTFVETAIVNGKVVYEKDKEPFYRHIKR